MKRLVLGILAHVDSGKTTLSERLLYLSGCIASPGRVDYGNSFLDTDKIERQRGITIFSKQAVFETDTASFTLLDTPGHIDFSAETERTLQVLDYAILVISASDGVQTHTETLWNLLKNHGIPTLVFVNKMDLPDTDKASILAELNQKLGDGFLDWEAYGSEDFYDTAAMCDEHLLGEFLDGGTILDGDLAKAVKRRTIFPCCFGSALKGEGVQPLLDCLESLTLSSKDSPVFGARVFKISQDEKGNRLTHMKITGGSLLVKSVIQEEKVNEIRIYSGVKYHTLQRAETGMVCAVTGLSQSVAGMGLGTESDGLPLTLEPVFTYRVDLPEGVDLHTALKNLRQLEEEETQLHVIWNEQLKEIRVRLMGEIQVEIFRQVIWDRFGMSVELVKGGVVYKETIAAPVEGVGHYEPLRHYAEVHLLMEPREPGSGLKFGVKCSEEQLDKNFQRLVRTHLEEKTHLGVLTGSPITDMKITLVAGKAHLKHTEGGDFRQATYRAVRQGLMQAESVLLEPWYEFILDLPTESVGKAMTDLGTMGGELSPPETQGERSVLRGFAPVSRIADYSGEVISYTHGKGRVSLTMAGYRPCTNQAEIVEQIGYRPGEDGENPASSVFCYHGAGTVVPWNEVFAHMHLPALALEKPVVQEIEPVRRRNGGFADESELMRIFENTYGKIKPREIPAGVKGFSVSMPQAAVRRTKPKLGTYVLVDGYNIIFAWEDLRQLAQKDLELARNTLIHRLCAYKSMREVSVIAVFDAYKVKGNPGTCEQIGNIHVVYTKEAETADAYIERTTHQLGKDYHVRVATSDYLEQLIILGGGAFRIPASEFLEEVEAAEEELRSYLQSEH